MGSVRECSPHQALDALTVGIQRKRVNWVLDADIRGFFDNLSHAWTMKFIEHRVADDALRGDAGESLVEGETGSVATNSGLRAYVGDCSRSDLLVMLDSAHLTYRKSKTRFRRAEQPEDFFSSLVLSQRIGGWCQEAGGNRIKRGAATAGEPAVIGLSTQMV